VPEPAGTTEQRHPDEVLCRSFGNVDVLLHIAGVKVDTPAQRLQESFLLCCSVNELTWTAEKPWKKLCLIPSVLLHACSERTSEEGVRSYFTPFPVLML